MKLKSTVITVIYIMMWFDFNYTFQLHKTSLVTCAPVSPTTECNFVHHDTIVDLSKKMASNIGTAIKRFKDSTQDLGKNIYNQVNSGLNSAANFKKPLTEEEVRQFELLLLVKKYPYLDLKEHEKKFSPSKNTRQSKFQPESGLGLARIWEPSDEDVPSVEVTNRGLSGFNMPPQMSRHISLNEKMKCFIEKLDENMKQKTPEQSSLGQLKDDVMGCVSIAKKINNAM